MPAPDNSGLIDRVDAHDRRTGQVKRGEALTLGVNFRTVHVFVIDDNDRLLLQRLAPWRDRHPERWGSSVAGYLHAGEIYEAAAERRLEEELCLRVPLWRVGKLSMLDERSQKFVTLFTAHSNEARNCAPDQIAELAPWPIPQLEATVREDPEGFTPTFLELFAFFRRTPPIVK